MLGAWYQSLRLKVSDPASADCVPNYLLGLQWRLKQQKEVLLDKHLSFSMDRKFSNFSAQTIQEWYSYPRHLTLRPMSECTCGCACTCDLAKATATFVEQRQLIQFLMGLNDEYDNVRSQILVTEPLPSVNRAYSMILRVERQR
ncbi:hypothetical protein Sango_2534700 [Sesamum angolense]|uniref:Uncharacterized protein n=1 Tax=Sesamum angolense TaxID=2727404 RepID=A0AAE1W4J1_9LAMI|nr:hypothetical protein Sango_2534700 [Sesamum angolense]